MAANGQTKPAVASLPLLAVADRAELRAWLEHNHDSSPGVNLAIGKKGGHATALTYDEAVEEALCFGWIDSTARRLDNDRYTVLFTPRKRGGTWARTNKARVERLIAEGRMTPAGIAVIEAAKADGSWMALEDAENLVVPDDLADALERAGARKRFDALTVSARQMALYWISTAKRDATRAERVSATAAAALEGRGPR
jgi:uncharacterized protein YdeI (YjbR/CyaY-like superfamily)